MKALASFEEFRLWPGLKPDTPARCGGRAFATESPRFRPALAWTLHLLLTLSDLFIIALWTKPPRPLVGDGGRSAEESTLEVRPSAGRSTSAVVVRPKGLNGGKSSVGDLEGEETIEAGLMGKEGSRTGVCAWSNVGVEACLGGDEERSGECGSSFARSSARLEALDIPGSLILRLEKEAGLSVSLSFFRYAAEFDPRSAVWRNHEGSLAPKEAAISCLDISSMFFGWSGFGPGLMSAIDATDCGLDLNEPVPLDKGRCFHDSVPLRDRAVAFVGGLGMDGFSARGWGGRGLEKSRDVTETRSAFGDIEPARPNVRD